MKKILLLVTLAIASINFKVIAQCTPDITTDLLAKWDFSGNADDSSGNGHNGTIVGALIDTNDRCNTPNSAYTSFGTTKYISVLDAQELRLNNTDFTISAWIYMTDSLSSSPNGATEIIDKRTQGGAGNYGWNLSTIAPQRRINFGMSTANPGYGFTSKNQIQLNCWNHILAEYFNSVQTGYLYINGILDTFKSPLPSPNPNANSNIRIGNDVAGLIYEFHGGIDDIRIYNRALDSCDIDSLYRTLCSPTGINENSTTSNIIIFPNPNNGNFIIEVSDYSLGNSILTVTNLIGEKLQERELCFGKNEITIMQPNGIYFLTVSNKSGRYTTKIIVQ